MTHCELNPAFAYLGKAAVLDDAESKRNRIELSLQLRHNTHGKRRKLLHAELKGRVIDIPPVRVPEIVPGVRLFR